jgi:translation initiation factor 3 subunit M
MEQILPVLCRQLANPVASSPNNSAGLSLSVLTTVFNIIEPDNDVRYHVFKAIIKVVKSSGTFEDLEPQLAKLDNWLSEWEMDEEDQRSLYLEVAEVASEASEEEASYTYLLRALRTFTPKEEVESRPLALRALKAAISQPNHLDFSELNSLDTIQALRKSDAEAFELLDVFSGGNLEDYNDFKDEHEGWIEDNGFDNSLLHRKMRLLTLASVAASTPSRSLPYKQISKALQVPLEDVEMWVIDVVRAGLVEGKLSQLNQTFLIHRSTYRVFGTKQWQEVAGRLSTWKESLTGVLEVIRRERLAVQQQQERDANEAERKATGARGMGGADRERAAPMQSIDAGAD